MFLSKDSTRPIGNVVNFKEISCKFKPLFTKREIIAERTDIHGFILSNYKINVNEFVAQNTKCGENLCDRQSNNIGQCACYQMDN